MKNYALLIVFLLVGFKSISQTGIPKDSVVILTERQARDVASDLVRYDACKQITKLQEERIKIAAIKEEEYKNRLTDKDSIIIGLKDYISLQKKMIKIKRPLEFHGYAGVQTKEFTLSSPTIYGRVLIEWFKINVGAQYFIKPEGLSGYNLIFEYKIF